MTNQRPTDAAELTAAYRRLLRVYPRGWRAHRGEEVLGTLLDGAEAAGRRRPSLADAVNLTGHGLATRVGLTVGWLPDQARRTIATVALAIGGVLAAAFLLLAERPDGLRSEGYMSYDVDHGLGPLFTIGILLYVPWIASLVAAAARRSLLSRWLAASTLPVTAVVLVVAATTEFSRPPLFLLAALGGLAVLVVGAPVLPGPPLTGAVAAVAGWCVVGSLAPLALAELGGRYYHGGIRWALGSQYRGIGFATNLFESLPATLVVALVLAGLVSVRRPGWLVAVFATGVVLAPIPVITGFNTWDVQKTAMEMSLIVAFGLSAAIIDVQRVSRLARRPVPALDDARG